MKLVVKGFSDWVEANSRNERVIRRHEGMEDCTVG